jgi:flap endonuclease-1
VRSILHLIPIISHLISPTPCSCCPNYTPLPRLRLLTSPLSRPLYVFDGKPPTLKSGELAKRIARKSAAEAGHAEARETGTAEEIEKFARRTVRVTREQNEDCKTLLKLMGIPFLTAPCEAEAQCAAIAKAGLVYAAASEDMDTLCFETPILLRHLTFSEQRKEPIQEIILERAMAGLGFSREQVGSGMGTYHSYWGSYGS